MSGPDLSASDLFRVGGVLPGNDAPEAPGDDTSAIPSALTRSARAVGVMSTYVVTTSKNEQTSKSCSNYCGSGTMALPSCR